MAEHLLSEPAFLAMDHAMILSDMRGSTRIDTLDWLGGLFVANLDRLAKYWRDPGKFEELVTPDPGAAANIAALCSRYPTSILEHRGGAGGAFKPFAPEGRAVWDRAMGLAGRAGNGGDTVVFPEHLLLAIAEQPDSELARRLAASGLRLDDLRRDVERGIS